MNIQQAYNSWATQYDTNLIKTVTWRAENTLFIVQGMETALFPPCHPELVEGYRASTGSA